MKKRRPFESALYQIEGQLSLDIAELAEWTPEYADYRDEHRQRIAELRAAARVLRACGKAFILAPGEDGDTGEIDFMDQQPIIRAILAARRIEGRKP